MKLKNKLLFSFLLAGVVLFIAAPVFAGPNINALTPEVAKQAGYDAADKSDTALSERVGGIIQIALTFVGTLFLILTVYAGFLWMTASGSEEKVTKATGILKMAVIGLIIVLSAYAITNFVVGKTVGSAQGTPVGGTPDPKEANPFGL